MKAITLVFALLIPFNITLFSLHAEQLPLDPHLEILRPMLGKTWKGPFMNTPPDKPMVDVASWERALNGHAVRVMHSMNDGIYGGETIITWDAAKKNVVYHYFTTDGSDTSGTLVMKDGKFVTHEIVNGDSDGVTEVRATTEILPDGTAHTKAEYLKAGKWVVGHEIKYKEDPSAKVVFK